MSSLRMLLHADVAIIQTGKINMLLVIMNGLVI